MAKFKVGTVEEVTGPGCNHAYWPFYTQCEVQGVHHHADVQVLEPVDSEELHRDTQVALRERGIPSDAVVTVVVFGELRDGGYAPLGGGWAPSGD
jgi:hypothetical protein